MLQVARLAPNLLQEAADPVCDFFLSQFNDDGGAKDRAGQSDLYYTVFALEGLSQLLETISEVRASINPDLEIQGIVLTMYDGRNNLANQVVEDVRLHMGEKVYQTVIPRNVRVSEAPSYGKPAILYDLKCSGSQAYLQLASEVIRRERQLRAA